MKKLVCVLISIFLVLSLSSCKPTASYAKIKDIESEIEKEYIALGNDGLVINRKEENIDLYDGYYKYSSKIDNDLIIKSKDEGKFYQSKYNLKDKTIVKNKLELENYKSIDYDYSNRYSAIINHENDYKDTAYVIDNDFNIKESILSETKDEYTGVVCSDFAPVFYKYTIDENSSDSFYKIEYLNELIIFKDDEFESIEFDIGIGFDEILFKYGKSIESNIKIIDNYFFVLDRDGISFIYDLKNKKIISNKELWKTLLDKLNDDIKDDIPKFDDVKNKKSYSYIFNSYCDNASINYNESKIIKIEDIYYYVIALHVNVSYLPWLLKGDSDYENLDARFIFIYDEDKDDIKYVGYSKGDIRFFYTF